jgi:hypothetical protein
MGYGSYNEDIDERKGDTSDRYERESHMSPDYNKSARDYEKLHKKFQLLERQLEFTQIDLREEQHKRQLLKLNFQKIVEAKCKAVIEELQQELKKAKEEQAKATKRLQIVEKWRQEAEDENKALKKELNIFKKQQLVKKYKN